MKDRIKTRQIDNYTFFMGTLTEEEQQYRDYYETDLEEDPESELIDEMDDEARIAQSG